MSINTRALRLAEIIAIPETVRDYQILLGLLEGICGLPPAEPMLNSFHEMGYQLGAEIHAELSVRSSTMAASIRDELRAQRDEAWRDLAAMRQERDWLRSVTAGLIKGDAEPGMVPVPSIELSALRELFIACGRTIHAATTSGSATLKDINDAWAGVCSAQISLRASSPAKDGGAA